MDTATIGIAEEEDEEQRMDEEHVFYRMVLFLAAITRGLFSRVLGADDPSFRPVMGKRGGVWRGDEGRLLQRADGGGLRDPEPLGEGRQGTGGGIAAGAQSRQQCGQEDVDPLIRFA